MRNHVRTYSAPAAAHAAGVTYRQLDYWSERGLVVPTFRANGSGSKRRYTEEDVACLRAVGLLHSVLGSHVPDKLVHRVCDSIRDGEGPVQAWPGILIDPGELASA